MNQTTFAGIVVAGVLVAGAIWLTAPRYQIAGDNRDYMRIDTRTGGVSYCKAASMEDPPICSDFGARTIDQFRADKAARQSPPLKKMTPEEVQREFDALVKGQTQE